MTENGRAERLRIKKWLYAYRPREKELEDIGRRIVALEEKVMSPRAVQLTGMPRGGSGEDALAAYVAKKDQLLGMYFARKADLLAEQAEIEEALTALESEERHLIRCRYMDGLKWDEVCLALGYEWAQTHRIHSRALNKLVDARR